MGMGTRRQRRLVVMEDRSQDYNQIVFEDFIMTKLSLLESRIQELSSNRRGRVFEYVTLGETTGKGDSRPQESINRAPNIISLDGLGSGSGGYTGPFAVSAEVSDVGERSWYYTIKKGSIQVHVHSDNNNYISTIHDVEETTQIQEESNNGTIYLSVSIDITGLISGDTVSVSASMYWPPDIPVCKIAIADIADGVITQRQYGDINIYMPDGEGMIVCEDGQEKCIFNFGHEIECFAMGVTVA